MPTDDPSKDIEKALGYTFQDRALLALALTHRSWVEEQHPGGAAPSHLSQQRLEFLGDALLNYVVGKWLYELLPYASEGELTGRRKQFTEGGWLRSRGEALGVSRWLRLGRGEVGNVGRNRRVLEDTTEAILGAVVLDGGDAIGATLIRGWLPPELPPRDAGDPIIRFGEWFQMKHRASAPEPSYESTGPDDHRTWTAEVVVDGLRGVGTGPGKKEAKRAACHAILHEIDAREGAAIGAKGGPAG